MHQRRLESVVILDTSAIVEEWIGYGGRVEKRVVTSNRSVRVEPHDADVRAVVRTAETSPDGCTARSTTDHPVGGT